MAECRELFARLSEYLDGELPPEISAEIRQHVEGCDPCVAFIEALRRTVDLCHHLPVKPLPDDLRRELRSLVAETFPSPPDQ